MAALKEICAGICGTHNKIGFFITGLVIIYSLSGLVQTYRDTDFLKHEVTNEKDLCRPVRSATGRNYGCAILK